MKNRQRKRKHAQQHNERVPPVTDVPTGQTADQVDEHIARSAQHYAEQIVATVREPLLLLDANLRVEFANRSFYATFQVAPVATVNQLIFDLGNGQWNIPALRTLLDEILPHNHVFEDFEVTHAFPTIGQRTMLLNARKLYRPGNNSERILLAIEDITARRRVEDEHSRLLASEQDARTAAQEAVRVRDAFLSLASHELKNPLAALLGNAQLLQRRATQQDSLSDRNQQAIGVIAEQAKRMDTLLTALLDVSRMELGQLTITPTPLDLIGLIHRVMDELQPTFEQHKIVWSGSDTPALVMGDVLRLEQVFQNLIHNAVKYSPLGGPVTLYQTEEAGRVCITVHDTGIGIPQGALSQLFRRFYRAENADTHRISGTGIGLYVVKEIVTLHGGEVTVISEEGQGSTFMVCLPLLGDSPVTS